MVEINPAVPEFLADPDALVTFMPLETVWADGRADTSRRAVAGEVAGSYTQFRSGDILLPKITPTFEAGRVFPVTLDTPLGAGTSELHILRVRRTAADPRFVAYLCRSQPFLQDGTSRLQGVGNLRRVPTDFISNFPVGVSDVRQQRAIADYLDRETARIDTLIEEQQRLIELLDERRWAVAEGAVAGLNWSTPLSYAATLIQTGPFGSQLKATEYEHGGAPVINPSHIVSGSIRPDPRVAIGPTKAAELTRHSLRLGDLVVARRGELGRCAVVGRSEVGAICGTGSALVRPDERRLLPEFAALVFASRRNRETLALSSVGSTMDNLNSDIIGALKIPILEVEEQRGIVSSVQEQTRKVDALITETERFIELARERRAALITAAVTGQIDVRGEAA
jgi:type I restriction enzyme S subunit